MGVGMKNTLKIWARIAMAIGLACVLVSCGSPAGVPAPPVEMPSPIVLKFVEPSRLQIDFSTISAAPAAAIDVYEAVGSGGTYSSAIALGAANVDAYFQRLTLLLNGIGSFEIPVSEVTTTFISQVFCGDGGFDTEGTPGTTPCTIKIDFGDFDFNADGVKDGCSGHTAALPICARLWVDDVRYLAWVFDTYPDDTIPGVGRFKLFEPEEAGGQLVTAFHYDQRDLENRVHEAFARMTIPQAPLVGIGDGHMEIAQIGPAATALKRINSYSTTYGTENGVPMPAYDGSLTYLGQYKEGSDYWSGSFAATGVYRGMLALPPDFLNVCAVISTGNAAEVLGICDDLGISVVDIAVVRPLVDSDISMPPDFPEAPTF